MNLNLENEGWSTGVVHEVSPWTGSTGVVHGPGVHVLYAYNQLSTLNFIKNTWKRSTVFA